LRFVKGAFSLYEYTCPTVGVFTFQAPDGQLAQYKLVAGSTTLNLTIPYNKVTLTGPVEQTIITSNGLIISADSDTSIYAVKADIGSTDGYAIPAITAKSTEFVIAGWR